MFNHALKHSYRLRCAESSSLIGLVPFDPISTTFSTIVSVATPGARRSHRHARC